MDLFDDDGPGLIDGADDGDFDFRSGGSTDEFDGRISDGREALFERDTGRFRDPDDGRFEPGGAPPDLDTDVDRYRAKNGQFKGRSADLYDEVEEVRRGSLDPRG